jgi:glycosyltransferase involved in cell wall biosynthesis
MKISLVIPAYNCSATIRMTVESALQQSLAADEILVMDDGSTDGTFEIANSFGKRVSVFRQSNRGVANARNELLRRSQGDFVAFLDSDDLWHPAYLEIQRDQWQALPDCVGYFTGHINFRGFGEYNWPDRDLLKTANTQLIPPVRLLQMQASAPGTFVSPSFLCLPRWVIDRLGPKPFCEEVSGVDDCHLQALLALLGPVAYCTASLGAYRLIDGSLSTDKMRGCELSVESYRLLKKKYEVMADPELLMEFRDLAASTRRHYAKRLMGAGRFREARKQFLLSIGDSFRPESALKSASMLFVSYMPSSIQPTWPPQYREVVDVPGDEK